MRSAGMMVSAAMLAMMTMPGFACSRVRDGGEIGRRTSPTRAPDAVETTWKAFGGGAANPEDVERETERGLETWSAEISGRDGKVEVTVLADGALVSIEREVAMADVPAAVREHAAQVLGAAPDSVDLVRLAVYEVENRTPAGIVSERFVDPFGSVLMTRTLPAGSEVEVAETLDQLPPSVRAAIELESSGAAIEELQRETDGGHEVHAASWQAVDGPRELKVLEDGTVISLELPTGALPGRVAAMVTREKDVSSDSSRIPVTRSDDDQEGDEPQENAPLAPAVPAVERMLLDAWECEVTAGDTTRLAIILPTGEMLGDVTTEPSQDNEED